MQDITKKIRQIEMLRQQLHSLISEKDSLLDKDIVEASKILDSMLNEYNELIKRIETK
ncbi:MAG: Spo0E like sporulation regulatory protein [Clostridia bacterium]|jgi:hypothetical protein|nr:Spo0E like sporulation regulatory protein [Clostridia bacterium]